MATSTTSKITAAMAASILAYCQQTGHGVMLRLQGEEFGYTVADRSMDLSRCTIPKSTLEQIGYAPANPVEKVFSVKYTSVRTLVKLANELHEAYSAMIAFSESDDGSQHIDNLQAAEERATERLALAIEKSTPERVDQAYKAVGEMAYVFDGF